MDWAVEDDRPEGARFYPVSRHVSEMMSRSARARDAARQSGGRRREEALARRRAVDAEVNLFNQRGPSSMMRRWAGAPPGAGHGTIILGKKAYIVSRLQREAGKTKLNAQYIVRDLFKTWVSFDGLDIGEGGPYVHFVPRQHTHPDGRITHTLELHQKDVPQSHLDFNRRLIGLLLAPAWDIRQSGVVQSKLNEMQRSNRLMKYSMIGVPLPIDVMRNV